MSPRTRKPAPPPAPAKEAASTPPSPPPSRPFHYRNRTLHCDNANLTALADEFGTPLYLYSAAQIRYRLALFQDAFAARPHTVCYAVKANSALAILRLLGQLGAGFDIVSGGELERVRRAHKPSLNKVVFSGVGKQAWEIDAALRTNILLFNVESAAELDLLAARAQALGLRARFALRVNPDVFADTHPYISTGLREHKFGIDITLARALYRKAARSPHLEAAGVSVHIGSQIRQVEPFSAALARVVSLIADLKRDGHSIRYIDAGGGLGIDYTDPPDAPTFNPARKVADYAAALNKALAAIPAEAQPHLLLEPGRFLIAQAGALLTRVLYVKQNGVKTFVIVDAAMNDLIRPALYQAHHEIIPITQPRTRNEMTPKEMVVDIVGPVCETGDFFARDRALPRTRPGDLLLILDAGAYALALSSNYNTRPRPAELLIDTTPNHTPTARLIRRRETLRDLLAPELP